MEKSQETENIYIQFFHPQGPAASFTYPVQLNKLTPPVNHISSLPPPISQTGRTYKLISAKSNYAPQLLKQYQEKCSLNIPKKKTKNPIINTLYN
jgi:hypothetical protein